MNYSDEVFESLIGERYQISPTPFFLGNNQTVNAAKVREGQFKNFFGRVKALLRDDWLKSPIGWRNREADDVLFKTLCEV